MNHNFEKFRKEEKNVFDIVWWSLFSSKLFIKQILLYQTRFACLMHLSRTSSNNLYFIITLSAKHERWSVFGTVLTFECVKKCMVNASLLSDWLGSVPPSLSSGEFILEILLQTYSKSITSIRNIPLMPNRSSILNSLMMLLEYLLSRLLLVQLLASSFESINSFNNTRVARSAILNCRISRLLKNLTKPVWWIVQKENSIWSNIWILIENSSNNWYPCLMKMFDAFAPAFTYSSPSQEFKYFSRNFKIVKKLRTD